MTTPLHQPFPHHILDSIEEVHAVLMGVALGVAAGLAIYYGARALGSFTLGGVSGAFLVLWWDSALVYWPAHGHAWYIVAPTALLAAAIPTAITRFFSEGDSA